MKYFATSFSNYLSSRVDRLQQGVGPGRRPVVTVPTLQENALLGLASTLASRALPIASLQLVIKIAEPATEGWSPQSLQQARRANWLDDQGSLTWHRNGAPVLGKTSLVVLFGADKIADKGSLDDFHNCDFRTIWNAEMKGSFQSWVRLRLAEAGMENLEPDHLKEFDRLLVPLCEHGKADLIAISDWLEELDLTPANSPREALKQMLGQLEAFRLPKFTRFPFGQKRASLARYIDKAGEFFSYSMFLESRDREKARRAIDNVSKELSEGRDTGVPFDDPDVLGPYSDPQALLAGLRSYVLTENTADREKLRRCEFTIILEKILKFRVKEEKPKKESLHKLAGGAVEVFLHAIWQTLRNFSKTKEFSDATIQKIELVADRFKHDYESPDESDAVDATADRTEAAREYLMRLLGGIDDLLKKHLDLSQAENQSISIVSGLANPEVPCTYAKTAEPQFEFSVRIVHSGDAEPFQFRFAWRLPEPQTYRLADSLLQWANSALTKDSATWKLPCFHLPYYEELLRAADDEETRRVMLHCVHDTRPSDLPFTNLLQREWLQTNDVLLGQLKSLAERYADFVQAAAQSGLHSALFGGKWLQLRRAYTSACDLVANDPRGAKSQMSPMLLRAFLMVQQRPSHIRTSWTIEPFEPSGIVTILHPALLEMLEAHVIFLFSCFRASAAVELRREDRTKAFAENIWTGYVDLAAIQSPLIGLLHNDQRNLDTTIKGQELIHCIGLPASSEAPLSTRLLVRYDNGADEEAVADTQMFRESRESKLLLRLLTDYFRLHPHARDGLNVAVFRNDDIQPVIAAVHQYLNQLADPKDPRLYVLKPDRRKPYAIGVTIFTESGDDVDVARWIEQWRERWEAAESETKFQPYRLCRFSVAHRVVEARNFNAFQKLINDTFEADIAILYNFIGAGQGGHFTEVAPFDIRERTLKFPILEKSCCAVRHPIDIYKRARVISNRQFELGSRHAEVMHRIKNTSVEAGKQFVVLGTGDFAPWQRIVDAFHGRAEWVICIDPNMDERLVRTPAGAQSKEREIIGFGSGVGSHGEANYTVSTEQFSLSDIQIRLAASIQEVYSRCNWASEEFLAASTGLLRVAHELSGLSLVRATGVGHYIRDFMANCLTRKMLREQSSLLCDHLVSLDAYRHWFDLAETSRRPDLMWVTAGIDPEGRVWLKLHLIECKVAVKSDEHLVKARVQINNGLRVLAPAFAPRSPDKAEDSRPDQRYWWLQLHRLITSKAEIEEAQKANVLSALERLAEGDYTISWDASVFAFWSDDDSNRAKRVGSWKPPVALDITAEVFTIGTEFVRDLATNAQSLPVPWTEWRSQALQEQGNVCDGLDDIEIPVFDEDDDEMPVDEEDEPDESVDAEPAPPEPAEPADLTAPVSPIEPAMVPEEGQTTPLPASSTGPGNGEPQASPAPTPSPQPPTETHATTITAPPQTRILLGTTIAGGKPVYWEFGHPELANRHMLVFGTSGMGKTYAIQCLLSELGCAGQNSLIIDYTDGFTPSKLESETKANLNPKQHFIRNEPLPINPFKAQVSEEAGMKFRDDPATISKRVAAIFKSVYELGNQQFPFLSEAIRQGLISEGDKLTFATLLDLLQTYLDSDLYSAQTVRTTITKLQPFIQGNPFAADGTGYGWQDLFADQENRCHVFQFYAIDRHSARAVIEFVLWDLYGFVTSFGNKHTPRVVVLDEVQNLDLGPDAPVAKYLTEGRKHGLALITATQTVKGVGGASDQRVSRFFQAEQKLFFKPTENELREHAQLLHNAMSSVSVPEWTTRLASLQKGECWSLGRSLNEVSNRLMPQAQRIKITSLKDRGFHA